MKHDLMRANQALHRRHAAKYLLETFRALGMTDDEIRAALTPAQTPTPTSPASDRIAAEPSGGAVQVGGARGASESSTNQE